MKLRRRSLKPARIEIIPMIDVIFFLLVFFMISSLSMTKLNSIPVALPKTDTTAESIRKNIILTVTKKGHLFINKVPATLENFSSLLAYEMRNHPQDVLVINADQGVQYGL